MLYALEFITVWSQVIILLLTTLFTLKACLAVALLGQLSFKAVLPDSSVGRAHRCPGTLADQACLSVLLYQHGEHVNNFLFPFFLSFKFVHIM